MLVVISLVGVTWFTDTLVGNAEFGEVSGTSVLIGPLTDLESGWFQGLFLLPTIPAALLLLRYPVPTRARSRPASCG